MEGCVEEMVLDPEIKEKFDDIDDTLKEHNGRLKSLEIEFAKTNVTLDYLKDSHDELKGNFKSLETTVVSNGNVMLNSINSLTQFLITKENNKTQKEINENDNNTTKKISKMDNKTKIILGILTFLGTALGIIGGKYLI